MNTPEPETQDQAQEPPVTPEERKGYERAVWAMNELYRRRERQDPETGKTYHEITDEELDIMLNAQRHISKRCGLPSPEETYAQHQVNLFLESIKPPNPSITREPVKPLPLP